MKRSFLGLMLTAFAVVLMSLDTFAQPPGGPGGRQPGGRQGGGPGGGPGGRGGMGGGMGMMGNPINNPEVQKLLGLSAEQTEQLKKVNDEIAAQMREAFQPPRRGEGGERPAPPTQEEMQKRFADMEKKMTENQAKVDKVLSPEQQGKFREIVFQLTGGLNSRMLNERSLEALNLTDDQKAKIKKLVDDQRAARQAAMGNRPEGGNASREDREKRRAAAEEQNKKFTEAVKGVLTAEQKAKAEKLTDEATALREKLGTGRRGGNNGGARGEGGRGDNYRPGAGTWKPGQGTGEEKKEGEAAPTPATKPRFPNKEN